MYFLNSKPLYEHLIEIRLFCETPKSSNPAAKFSIKAWHVMRVSDGTSEISTFTFSLLEQAESCLKQEPT